MYPHFEIIIPAYALFTCIGLFFMMLAIYYRSKKLQISFESFLLLMGILAAGAVLGSKCLFIITQIPQIIDNFSIHKKYSLQGTTQGRYLTGGVPPVRFSM